MPATLSPEELAALAELNEARVYESLFSTAALPGYEVGRLGPARMLRARPVPSMVLLNRVLGWGHGEPHSPDSLDQIAAFYGDAGFGIELSPRAADEASQWLPGHGLRRISAANVLARDGRNPPQRYAAWRLSTGLRIEPATPQQIEPLTALLCETFNLPREAAELLRRGTAAPAWRRWVALDGEQLVGGSLSHVDGEFAWFGWTAVHPSHRGRWVHTGVLARQLEEAAAAGARWVTTETALSTRERPDAAYLNLKRFGFTDAYVRPIYVRAPRRNTRTGTQASQTG